MIYDAIIIGGGAAGLFCAITAGKRGRRVLVIEHNAEIGRKIIISGGGRCNFTNIHTQPENFISQNPHFCKSALAAYRPQDFVELVKKHKIAFYEKKLGQLFCRESSRQIITMLLDESKKAGVEIRTNCSVKGLRGLEAKAADADSPRFAIATSGQELLTRSVVIACGGLSFPKIGASDFGYQIARQFGIKIVKTRPSLVALVLKGKTYEELAGVSIDSTVSVDNHNFRENVLFTHRGMSGPAILQISNYWKPREPVTIDLLPEKSLTELLIEHRPNNSSLGNFLSGHLPRRFVREVVKDTLLDTKVNNLTESEIRTIGQAINQWRLNFIETEGYGRAEVTLGGVSTAELSSQTMEAVKVPGLFFVGEVVDVTGWLGGYNFQWAWASGFAAGRAV